MTTPTDSQLKLALAKLLPERIDIGGNSPKEQARYLLTGSLTVKETKGFHIFWLIEKNMIASKSSKRITQVETTEHEKCQLFKLGTITPTPYGS